MGTTPAPPPPLTHKQNQDVEAVAVTIHMKVESQNDSGGHMAATVTAL